MTTNLTCIRNTRQPSGHGRMRESCDTWVGVCGTRCQFPKMHRPNIVGCACLLAGASDDRLPPYLSSPLSQHATSAELSDVVSFPMYLDVVYCCL